MTNKIEPYYHRCTVRSGPMEGNKYIHKISSWHIEFEEKCPECGDLLADSKVIIAHIYEQLVDDSIKHEKSRFVCVGGE
jgi:hypothetical protein